MHESLAVSIQMDASGIRVAFSDNKIVPAGDGRRLGYCLLGRKYRPMKNRRIEAW